jgi:hypothetical protein
MPSIAVVKVPNVKMRAFITSFPICFFEHKFSKQPGLKWDRFYDNERLARHMNLEGLTDEFVSGLETQATNLVKELFALDNICRIFMIQNEVTLSQEFERSYPWDDIEEAVVLALRKIYLADAPVDVLRAQRILKGDLIFDIPSDIQNTGI